MNALSKIISSFFLLVILLGIVKNSLLYTVYNFNSKLFTEVLCENKEKPELHCEGKCYISKMKMEENNKKSSHHSFKQVPLEISFFNPLPQINFQISTTSFIPKAKYSIYLNPLYAFTYIFNLVKPPEYSL